jgi:hypothetical protein
MFRFPSVQMNQRAFPDIHFSALSTIVSPAAKRWIPHRSPAAIAGGFAATTVDAEIAWSTRGRTASRAVPGLRPGLGVKNGASIDAPFFYPPMQLPQAAGSETVNFAHSLRARCASPTRESAHVLLHAHGSACTMHNE